MQRVIGLITCNYSSKDPGVLADNRPIAATPYLGRYRLIDFPMSNMVNAGIRTIGMVMPHNYRSIIDHVGAGKDWDLDRKNGGLFILPGSAFGTARTGSRFLIRDLIENKAIFLRNTSGYVVFSSANFVYNYDINELVAAHVASGADITALTKVANESDVDVVSFDVNNGRVTGMRYGVEKGEVAFLDCFVVKRQLLLDMLDWYAASDHLDLFEAIMADPNGVTVSTVVFEGYCAAVFNKQSYFRASMDLLSPKVSAELFPSGRFIKTKAHDTSPAKHEVGSKVTNSLISAGCRIYGTVDGSVLSRNVVVEPGAQVKDSIIMQGTIVKAGAQLENCIVDRNNVIPAGTVLKGTPDDVLVKGKPAAR